MVFVCYRIDNLKAIDLQELFLMPQSVCIRYGGLDEDFAYELKDALHRNGVRTWLIPDDAEPGQSLSRERNKGVKAYDRIILICSKHSLVHPGMLNEIEQALRRESQDGGKVMVIPILLDRFIFQDDWAEDHPDLRQQLRDRIVANFRDTEDGDGKFIFALAEVLDAIKRRPKKTSS